MTYKKYLVSSVSGKFAVKVISDNETKILVQDQFSFDEVTGGFTAWVGEGTGGVTNPRKLFHLVFPGKESRTYDALELKSKGSRYLDYSQTHWNEYVPDSGEVTITALDMARVAQGHFELKMTKIEGTGPAKLTFTGSFDLKKTENPLLLKFLGIKSSH